MRSGGNALRLIANDGWAWGSVHRWARHGVALGCAVAVVIAFGVGASAQSESDPSESTFAATERRTFTDAEITDGFFKVTFGAEFHVAGATDRIRKYEGPVRVFVDNQAEPDRSGQVATVVSDIRDRIRDLDIAMTPRRSDAQIVVSLLRDRDLPMAIRDRYGIDHARRIQSSLMPQCLSGFRRDANARILSSDVLIVADAGTFVFNDCIYEELLQSLGPINDDTTVPWTMFNDEVRLGYFGVYDQYLLNILYDSRIRAGMTRADVEAVLPAVLPGVREWVDAKNPPRP